MLSNKTLSIMAKIYLSNMLEQVEFEPTGFSEDEFDLHIAFTKAFKKEAERIKTRIEKEIGPIPNIVNLYQLNQYGEDLDGMKGK